VKHQSLATGLIFPFIFMCTQHMHYIHSPTPSLPFNHTHTGTNFPDGTCSAPLFSVFFKRK
jgi:hypothetical protein